MPLDKSGSKAAIGHNIKAEEAAGKPHKQAVAIALNTQRRAGGKVAPKPKKGKGKPRTPSMHEEMHEGEAPPTYNSGGKRGSYWWM